MTAVPRLFEQVYHKIVKKGMAAGGFKPSFFMGFAGGQDIGRRRKKKSACRSALAAKHALASKLVFSKWREGVGGAIRFFVSGGAPLSKKTFVCVLGGGHPDSAGYGMTEACVASANRIAGRQKTALSEPF